MSRTFALMGRRVALLSGTFALMGRRVALLSGTFALIRRRVALISQSFGQISRPFALMGRSFALFSRRTALCGRIFALLSGRFVPRSGCAALPTGSAMLLDGRSSERARTSAGLTRSVFTCARRTALLGRALVQMRWTFVLSKPTQLEADSIVLSMGWPPRKE
jgi:hypothetical protein